MTEQERMEAIIRLNDICQKCLKGIDKAKRLDSEGVVHVARDIIESCEQLTLMIETAD